MTRPTYSDLFLNFTPPATGTPYPTQTQCNNLITHALKLSYSFYYGLDSYSTDDSTDADGLLVGEEFYAELVAEVSNWAQKWNEAGKSSNGEITQMPKFTLSKELKTWLNKAKAKKYGLFGNIRVYGSDQWDTVNTT